MPISINLLQPDAALIPKLIAFLQEDSKEYAVWEKNYVYKLLDGTEFVLEHVLFQRYRANGEEGARFEVISNGPPISKGNFSEVYKIEATFIIEGNRFVYRRRGEGHDKLVKIQTHNPEENPIEIYIKQCDVVARVKHLNLKPPAIMEINHNTQQSFTVINALPGIDLFEILNNDVNRNKVLSVQQRLDLSRQLLLSYKKQVVGYGLIHCDIKPENILVQLEPSITVNFIDYDFSTYALNPDGTLRGSIAYLAPEMLKSSPLRMSKVDLFSLGRTIAPLWGISLETYRDHVLTGLNPRQLLANLFQGMPNLDPQSKWSIRTCLLGLLQTNPEDRMNLDATIAHFPSKINEQMLLPIPQAARNKIKHPLFSSRSFGNKPLEELIVSDKRVPYPAAHI